MKNLTFIISLFTILISNAQTPIINIGDSRFNQPDGYYMKDINNQLNPFQGTYVYTNGTTSFKIVLTKKIQQYNGRYYEDLIIGEYQYIKNGVEQVNTLNLINTVYSNQTRHNIAGNSIVDNNFRYWKCPTCAPNEKRLKCSIVDEFSKRYGSLIMRRTIEAGVEVMKINISHISRAILVEGQPAPPEFSLPIGELTLIKQ